MAEDIRNAYELIPTGTPVEVRDRFEQSFHPGFEVTSSSDGGYQLRRMSDRVELPAVFAADDVRPAN